MLDTKYATALGGSDWGSPFRSKQYMYWPVFLEMGFGRHNCWLTCPRAFLFRASAIRFWYLRVADHWHGYTGGARFALTPGGCRGKISMGWSIVL